LAAVCTRAEARPKGDVNLDGSINGLDVRAFVTVLLAPGSASPAARCAADTSEDTDIDFDDVPPMVDLLLGRTPTFYATRGHWECPFDWGFPGALMTPIHAAVVPIRDFPNGPVRLEVLTFGHYENPHIYRWNPQTGAFAVTLWPETIVWRQCGGPPSPPAPGYLFCAGHSLLADGRLLMTGGNIDAFDIHCPGEVDPAWSGPRFVHLFDGLNLPNAVPAPVAEMSGGRWYPTNTMLEDGRVLTVAGLNECGYCDATGEPVMENNASVEIYNPPTPEDLDGSWTYAGEYELPLYPQMFLLSNGNVFYAGPGRDTAIFNPQTLQWTGTNWQNHPHREYGPAVLVPNQPDTVMIMGGECCGPAVDSTEIIHLQDPDPEWEWGQEMSLPRCHAMALLLPDQSLLVVGGRGDSCFATQSAWPCYVPDRYDFLAANPTFVPMSSHSRPRMYHSTAVLLPDGRVLSMGGTATTGWPEDETNAEIYHPPYLFRGPRPMITASPATAGYGQQVALSVPTAGAIASVVLMRPSSVTHATNMDQRVVPLSFQMGGPPGTLLASMPANARLAPPGYYMIFVVDGQGVPSEARVVHLQP